ncbi:hypothetical protein REPUB_Repub13aG0194000 [Reevesia pubescens]
MLSEGISNIRHRDTCMEEKKFFHEKLEIRKTIRGMFGIDIESRSFFVEIGSQRKSVVFFEECQIAHQLQTLVSNFRWDDQEKWKLIVDVWLNMLTYAASQCPWKEHATQLQQGEELLTQATFLMAHLGLRKSISWNYPKHLRLSTLSLVGIRIGFDRLAYYLA